MSIHAQSPNSAENEERSFEPNAVEYCHLRTLEASDCFQLTMGGLGVLEFLYNECDVSHAILGIFLYC